PLELTGLFSLELDAQAEAIPAPVSPLTLNLDTALVPDPATEIWPVQLNRKSDTCALQLWASAPAVFSLESVLERFREALHRAFELFPFLPGRIEQIQTPLYSD